MTVEIVPKRLEHVDSFRRSLDVVAREKRYLAMTEAPPIESTRAFVADNQARGAPQCVALIDGQVVGRLDVVPHSLPTAAHCGTFGIGVLPEHRGQGGAATDDRGAGGCPSTRLVTGGIDGDADNVRAIRLYERVGFVREVLKRKARRSDGHDTDVVLMAIIDFERWTAPTESA